MSQKWFSGKDLECRDFEVIQKTLNSVTAVPPWLSAAAWTCERLNVLMWNSTWEERFLTVIVCTWITCLPRRVRSLLCREPRDELGVSRSPCPNLSQTTSRSISKMWVFACCPRSKCQTLKHSSKCCGLDHEVSISITSPFLFLCAADTQFTKTGHPVSWLC